MNYHLQSLGWTLLHFCWQAGVIALVYWLADAALSKASSQTRYWLALGVMLLMFAGALATLGYEEMRTYYRPSFLSSTDSGAGPSVAFDLAALAGRGTSGSSEEPVRLSQLLPWLDVAWSLGVACFSTRTIAGWGLLQRLRKQALVEAPEGVSVNFTRLCNRLGIQRRVSLLISEHIQGPLAMGIVRAVILLPASTLMALSPEQLEAVLAHELAHIRRADYFWNLVQTTVETLFFFHPAVWWLGHRVRHHRELCCDDLAVQSCGDAVLYATALLRLEEQRSRQLNLAMALDGHRSMSGLRTRIARILGESIGRRGSRELAPLPLAAIFSGVMLLLLSVPPLLAGLPASQAATMTPAVTALGAATLAPPVSNPVVSPPTRRIAIAASPVARLAAVMPPAIQQSAAADSSAHKADYIDEMHGAGYDVDIDKYVAMKVQGITPDYAREMAKAGFGKPSADDLIAMKVQGVTPDYVSQLHAAGIEPGSFSDLVAYRIFHVTPEFVAGMKAAGFESIPPSKLVALRVHGVTPEYAKTVKQQYPNATLDELVQLRIFHIDDAFLAAAKRHGFTSLSIEKLVQLRISGVLGDDDAEAK
jgi:Zn-dependent protease with chaperone function/ABC-type amino acid transport substrate-binding protein